MLNRGDVGTCALVLAVSYMKMESNGCRAHMLQGFHSKIKMSTELTCFKGFTPKQFDDLIEMHVQEGYPIADEKKRRDGQVCSSRL